MDEVLRLRCQIDETDLEIIRLLKSRYESARRIGEIKRVRGLGLRDHERETAILREMDRAARSLDLEPALVRDVFKRIFVLTVNAQKVRDGTRLLDGLTVLVIGGTGGMGRLFAQLAQLNGASVKILGRNRSRTRKVAKDLELEAGSISDAKSSDIVIVAVPMTLTKGLALEAAKQMKAGGLLTDLSSVKTGVADQIAAKIPGRIEFVSLHPLFSPEVNNLDGQNIVAIPFKQGPSWRKLSSVLKSEGATVETSSVKAHDLAMSYVQVIHHFALLSLGMGLIKWNGDFPTNSLKSTGERIRGLLRNWNTIMNIQSKNPFAKSARKEFLSVVGKLQRTSVDDQGAVRKRLTAHVQKWTRKT